AALNIVLDPLLILGIGGFPRLELQGAAIATVIARATTLVAALFVLHFKERMLYLKIPSAQDTFWCWKDILYVGLPAAGSNMINPISIGVITSLLAGFGAEAVAAFGVASRIESLAMIALIALSASMAPFVGQNWGAKKYARVGKALQLSFVFCVIWGLIGAAILAVSAPTLVAFFNQNPDVVRIASQYLWIVQMLPAMLPL
ncbi:MAG: MATE family efflux transporter, partial [Cyanobacteria bacterium J06628_3]